jgi:hypothetical protein
MVGLSLPVSAATTGLTIYDIGSGRYEDVPDVTSGPWMMALWLDDRRLLVRDERGIAVVTPDGRQRRVLDVGGYYVGRSLGVSRDGRWISYTETGTSGDIWLATLR